MIAQLGNNKNQEQTKENDKVKQYNFSQRMTFLFE